MASKILKAALVLGVIATFVPASIDGARADATLDKIKKEGVLKVCVPPVIPDLYKDARTGEWSGVMADLLKTQLAQLLGRTGRERDHVESLAFDTHTGGAS